MVAEDFLVEQFVKPLISSEESGSPAIDLSGNFQWIYSSLRKIRPYDIPNGIVDWIIDFLTGREQRVKLHQDCYSEWGAVTCGVSQSTKLGP